MIVIYQNTNIDLQTLIVWACKNGADFLGLNNLGTFEKGKVPGVNIIKNLDDNFQLTKDSYVRPFLFD
jgi:cytosine/adenosine deaminase-related metal-dependent hydrolase